MAQVKEKKVNKIYITLQEEKSLTQRDINEESLIRRTKNYTS